MVEHKYFYNILVHTKYNKNTSDSSVRDNVTYRYVGSSVAGEDENI